MAFIALEGLNLAGAWSAYGNYVDSTNRILQESMDGERMGPTSRDSKAGSPETTAPAATAAAVTPSAETTVEETGSCDITGAQAPPK